jgi:hypothetical protein
LAHIVRAMPNQSDLAILREAKKALETELDKLTLEFESRAEPIKKQLADFEAAERVWTSLIGKSAGPVQHALPMKEKPGLVLRLPNRKPEGMPTVPDMILTVLRDFEHEGVLGVGVTPEAILTEIRRRWWPEARSGDVGPIAWRMAVKEQRLEKTGSLYSLLPESGKEAAE